VIAHTIDITLAPPMAARVPRGQGEDVEEMQVDAIDTIRTVMASAAVAGIRGSSLPAPSTSPS
jgi:hypothetical protein